MRHVLWVTRSVGDGRWPRLTRREERELLQIQALDHCL